MSGKAGKKTNFYIGYLRNENILILLNAYYNMGLFIKIREAGLERVQPGWRQILDKDIKDYRDGVDVLCYKGILDSAFYLLSLSQDSEDKAPYYICLSVL